MADKLWGITSQLVEKRRRSTRLLVSRKTASIDEYASRKPLWHTYLTSSYPASRPCRLSSEHTAISPRYFRQLNTWFANSDRTLRRFSRWPSRPNSKHRFRRNIYLRDWRCFSDCSLRF